VITVQHEEGRMSDTKARPTPRPAAQADGAEANTTDATATTTPGAPTASGDPAEKATRKKDDEGGKSTISNVR